MQNSMENTMAIIFCRMRTSAHARCAEGSQMEAQNYENSDFHDFEIFAHLSVRGSTPRHIFFENRLPG